jgi:dTDP-4-dehydrorhamnose reductase
MRVLILGGTGMLGHKLWQVLRDRHEVHVAARLGWSTWDRLGLYEADRFHGGLEAADPDTLLRIMGRVRPEVVVNCVGIVKQVAAAKDPLESITVNALFPHRVARACQAAGARLIQISTDCVFSGRKGGYTEGDVPDAEDLYGRSKLLGEVTGPGCLTVRTSMIGRELTRQSGLLEWFLSQRQEQVPGYTNAIFSGFTTPALGEILARIIQERPDLTGLYHVASEPISKYALLKKLAATFASKTEVEPSAEFRCDRSLDGTRFRLAMDWQPPSWDEMIKGVASDPTPYDQWRRM